MLQRHVINHDSEGANKRQKVAGTSRARVTRACIACAESKLKCEGGEPCQRCQTRGTSCRYKSPTKRSSVAASTRNSTTDANRQPQSQTHLPQAETAHEPPQPSLFPQMPVNYHQNVPIQLDQADTSGINLPSLVDFPNGMWDNVTRESFGTHKNR